MVEMLECNVDQLAEITATVGMLVWESVWAPTLRLHSMVSLTTTAV